ncbi:MAG: FtsK/SpoIIIE domain-containing protein, partial [Acidobacteriota bacterium]
VGLDGARHSFKDPFVTQVPERQVCSQLEALVGYLNETAVDMKLERLSGPWLPPLPESVYLEDVMSRDRISWDGEKWTLSPVGLEVVLGLVDDPAEREQRPLVLNLAREGHVALYGVPGSGKTTFVQTMITSLAMAYSPNDVNIYILDCGGRNLSLFEKLPHVGAIIFADETERVIRLFKRLDKEMRLRKELFASAGVTTLGAYRAQAEAKIPAFVVMLDNYSGFTAAFPDEGDLLLANIVREGGNLGIHLLLTANNPSMVRYSITSNVTYSIALQLAERGDYGAVLGRMLGVAPDALPGRGMIKGTTPLEFQTALPSAGINEAGRSSALRNMVNTMNKSWAGKMADTITILPETVDLSSLLGNAAELPIRIPIGIEIEDFAVVQMNLTDGPNFMVCGPMQSGKTTLLQSIIVALSRSYTPDAIAIHIVDSFNSYLELVDLPQIKTYIQDEETMSDVMEQISETIAERREYVDNLRSGGAKLPDWIPSKEHPLIVIIIDGYEFTKSYITPFAGETLETVIRKARGLGIHIILAGSPGDISGSYDNWIKALKEQQNGVLLGTTEYSDLQMFGIRLPFGSSGRLLPPGEGFYARRRQPFQRFKAAVYNAGNFDSSPMLEAAAGEC